MQNAIGFVETRGDVAAFAAADAMVKAANVTIIGREQVGTGLISVLVLLISPGVVGVFFIADRFAGHWLSVVVALVAGTLLSSVTTLWLMKKTAGDRTRGHSHD